MMTQRSNRLNVRLLGPTPFTTPFSEYLQADGAKAAHFEYDAFGRLIVDEDQNREFPIRFSTKRIDFESGLFYYGYRCLDPASGRWLSRDPIGENGGVNIVGFVKNNPNSYVDEWGLLFDVSYAEQWISGKIDEKISEIGNGISNGVSSVKSAIGNEFSSRWTPSIGTSFTTTWSFSKSIIQSQFLDLNVSAGLSVWGYKKDAECKDCVEVYGTLGGTITGKAPLGNPLVQLIVAGNGSLQTTWRKCKNRSTGEYTEEWDKLYLVVTPRIGLRVGGDTGVGVAAYGEGGGWLSVSKDLLSSSRATITGGWYLTGYFELGPYERRFTLSNGSPNF